MEKNEGNTNTLGGDTIQLYKKTIVRYKSEKKLWYMPNPSLGEMIS